MGSSEIGEKCVRKTNGKKKKKKNKGFTTRPAQKKWVLWLRELNAA